MLTLWDRKTQKKERKSFSDKVKNITVRSKFWNPHFLCEKRFRMPPGKWVWRGQVRTWPLTLVILSRKTVSPKIYYRYFFKLMLLNIFPLTKVAFIAILVSCRILGIKMLLLDSIPVFSFCLSPMCLAMFGPTVPMRPRRYFPQDFDFFVSSLSLEKETLFILKLFFFLAREIHLLFFLFLNRQQIHWNPSQEKSKAQPCFLAFAA